MQVFLCLNTHGAHPHGQLHSSKAPPSTSMLGSSSFHPLLYDDGSYQEKTSSFLGGFTAELRKKVNQDKLNLDQHILGTHVACFLDTQSLPSLGAP